MEPIEHYAFWIRSFLFLLLIRDIRDMRHRPYDASHWLTHTHTTKREGEIHGVCCIINNRMKLIQNKCWSQLKIKQKKCISEPRYCMMANRWHILPGVWLLLRRNNQHLPLWIVHMILLFKTSWRICGNDSHMSLAQMEIPIRMWICLWGLRAPSIVWLIRDICIETNNKTTKGKKEMTYWLCLPIECKLRRPLQKRKENEKKISRTNEN